MKARRAFWMRALLPAFGALLLLNLVVFAAWTLPRSYRQRNAAARLQRARVELAGQRRQVAALHDRAAAIRANSADLGRFYQKQVGSESSELFSTYEAIEAMARAPGLRPGSRSIQREPVRAAPLERVRFTLPLEGSYGQLVGFLREVESSPRFLTIDSVSMHAVAERGATLQVQVSAYFKAAPGSAPRRGGHAG